MQAIRGCSKCGVGLACALWTRFSIDDDKCETWVAPLNVTDVDRSAWSVARQGKKTSLDNLQPLARLLRSPRSDRRPPPLQKRGRWSDPRGSISTHGKRRNGSTGLVASWTYAPARSYATCHAYVNVHLAPRTRPYFFYFLRRRNWEVKRPSLGRPDKTCRFHAPICLASCAIDQTLRV